MRRRFPLTLHSLLALAVTLLATVPATAQDADNPFGEVIDVRVVNLEVVVTDGGERVTGLGPEDFLLTVDGAEVPIEYFTEVSGGTAVADHGALEEGTVPALAPGVPVPTSYLVFIDEYFTVASRRNQVLSEVLEQLPMLNPEDRMAVVAFDGRKLDMLSSWSQSVAALTRVFEAARERPTFGVHRFTRERLFAADVSAAAALAERVEEFERPDLFGAGIRVGSDLPTLEEEQLIGMLTQDVKKVVMAASSTLRSFANPPGRKVMLLVAGGWPYTPAQWVVSDPTRSVYTTGYGYGDNLYAPLIETANRLSYTLYPIDVPFQPDAAASATAATVDDAGPELAQLGDNVQDQRAALRRLAYDTGGRALLGNAALRALESVVTDTRSYYWIGFTPQWKGDDEAHRIDVAVRRGGLKARTRQSYSDLSRRREVTMMVESALRLGDAPTMTPMPARVGEVKKAGGGKVDVEVQVLVPMAALTFLPHDGKYLAQAELRVAVQDDAGALPEIPVVPMTVTHDGPPKEGEMRRWTTHVTLRKKRHDMVVSIYDVASGNILSTKLEVDPR